MKCYNCGKDLENTPFIIIDEIFYCTDCCKKKEEVKVYKWYEIEDSEYYPINHSIYEFKNKKEFQTKLQDNIEDMENCLTNIESKKIKDISQIVYDGLKKMYKGSINEYIKLLNLWE